ncbi:Actin/actin-like protein [Aulographum hederae CBS 113979]|uniref:Actin-like protein ARP6 n=1 Tax=Aulographum hederae CBS 113979 TaxID=1176131 RepID=A0A6G1H140_9PEZI|nr:Actin/actin-like protein [Aulographum hederae CBS 113979]
MPVRNAPTPQRQADRTLVVDNGAYSIKAGYAVPGDDLENCKVIPNCIARSRDRRVFIASQLAKCKDYGEMAFRRPVEKGYVVNWEGEKAIWEQSLFDSHSALQCKPRDTNLILTEAPNCPQALQTNSDQIIFEEFEFASLYRCPGLFGDPYNNAQPSPSSPPISQLPAECVLLVDSGYSHTTVTPLLRGRPIQPAIRRLDIGGKFLTNYLKELLSLRQVDMREESYIVDEIKADTCFVSPDFRHDLERTWKGGLNDRRDVDLSVVIDYVLPDYESLHHGVIRVHDPTQTIRTRKLAAGPGPKEMVLTLGNERFAVPELLFNPGDVGMKEVGLPDLVMQSLAMVPRGLWPGMLANVVVVGGNAKINGFLERLEAELRTRAPSEFILRIKCPEDPIKYTWLGGARMASNQDTLKQLAVTRQEYEEHGHAWVARQFASR